MSQFTKIGFCIAVAAALTWLTGCRESPDAAAPPATSPDPGAQPPAAPAPAPPATDEPAAGDQGAATREIEAAFASLSADDRVLATKQRICPVSAEPLGSMGKPIKVIVAGHEVFVCCESCKAPLTENPAEHLAKIGLTPTNETVPQ